MARPFSAGPAKPLCAAERTWVDSATKLLRDMLYESVRDVPGAKTLDIYPVLCDAQYCYAKSDGLLPYADTIHLTRAGFLRFAGRFDF